MTRHTSLARLLCLLLSLTLLCGLLPAQAENAKKKVTVIMYMCGADLESTNFQASQALSSVGRSHYNTDEINVIALLGGAMNWGQGFPVDRLTIVQVNGRREQTEIGTMPLSSMGDPDTLTNFLEYCYTNYPAEQNILIMWNHGGGPLRGLCFDYLYNSDSLSLNEFSHALAASPYGEKGLDIIAFNACLMGSAETSYAIAPYAKYMVAAEDTNYGITYDWINGLEKEADLVKTADTIARLAFDLNTKSIEAQNAKELINSFSVIDLSKIDALVRQMDEFFPLISENMLQSSFTAMSSLRRDTLSFGVGDTQVKYVDLVDLGDLVSHYASYYPEQAKALLSALEDAVVSNYADRDTCHGLTVYHPFENKSMLTERIPVFNSLGFSSGYTEYVQRFTAHLTGTPLANWTNMRIADASKVSRSVYTLELTEEQAANFGAASMEVLRKNDDGSYTFFYTAPKTSFDSGSVSGEFLNLGFYAVAADGALLSAPLPYAVSREGCYTVSALLHRDARDGGEELTASALISLYAGEDGSLTPGAVQIWDDATQCYSSAMGLALADFDTITVDIVSRTETKDETGALKAFAEWEKKDTVSWTQAIGEWRFALVEDTLDQAEEEKLYISFQVADSQNNHYSSGPDALYGNIPGVFSIHYDDMKLVRIPAGNGKLASVGGKLLLSLTVQNLTDTEATITLENLTINGVALDASATAYGSGKNWGLPKDEEQPLSLTIDPAALAGIDTITGLSFDLTLTNAADNTVLGTVPCTGTGSIPLAAN